MSMFDGTPPPQGGSSRVRPHGNLMVLRIAVFVFFGLLAVRLADMQIINGDDYATRARENHIQSEQILPSRGLIYDADGEPLVQNVGQYTLEVVPELLPNPDLDDDATQKRRQMFLFLEESVGVPALEIEAHVAQAEATGRENQAIRIRQNLEKEEALALSEVTPDMPGVNVTVLPARRYIGGESFSHILGYVGPITAEEWVRLQDEYEFNQPVGKAGIEARYEDELRGTVGRSSNEMTASGEIVNVLETEEPEPGNSLRLSIDADLQEYVTDLMRDRMGDANNAAAVVMDVNTGAVEAMVSLPTWDNNIFGDLEERGDEYERLIEDPAKPLINRATSPEAPGSTFKLVTAAAGLEEGNITPSTGYTVDSLVKEFVGENGEVYPYYDWAVHGYVQLHEAIARSSNIYFYMTSCGFQDEGLPGLGSNVEDSAYKLRYWARSLGFGKETGLDIGGESAGIIPDPQWKRESRSNRNIFAPGEAEWYHADTCFMGIGQGDVTATPLQVNRMTAAIANGGRPGRAPRGLGSAEP
ncbi:MAG: penicillin-binding transpeptidase domain-containing protein [Dehalococcoidia bacterium]|nr:penicillin-binding transpeptidase domain-containing protein [Dehalococcoidia bacterium]